MPTLFSSEAEMAPYLRPHIRSLAGTPVQWFTEVPAVNGIPDVILARFDPTEVRRRARHGLRMPDDNSVVRAALTLTDHADGLTVTDLARVSRISTGLLKRRVLPTLAEHGWVDASQGVWRMARRYSDPAALLITVELKLRDWRRALTQALHQTTGSDASWVVLDASTNRALEHRRHFEIRGVGLALLDPAGLESVEPARPADYDPARRAVLAERVLAMRNAGVEVGPERHVFGRILT